ncbi:MAG: hypothetical protein AB4372_28205 [Xenococcus sp. (in: cyanobacteria)]
MPKIPDCDRCSLYAHNPHLICAVHPNGVESDNCLDFRLDPNFQKEEQWAPEGYCWYGGELIPNKPSRYTAEEQLFILDNHPFFTGVCPDCGHKFDKANPPAVHWDCPNPECDYVDESV